MIYDMRVYEPHPGKAGAMRTRFLHHAMPAMRRCGMEIVQVFAARDSENLCYIVRFADTAARDAAWASFKDDAAWLAAKQASETDGPLLKTQTVTVLESLLDL